MKKIVFQGDSITDCGRDRTNNELIGSGYACLVKANMMFEYPTEYRFFNRGINGNRSVDLYARIKSDIINLQPDYISFLIGVNDVWQEIGSCNGVSAEKYEKIYCMMLDEILEALPNVKIMIMEPFCLRGEATNDTEEHPNKWKIFRTEVELRAERARCVAEKYNLPFVELQKKFDEMAEKTRSENWLWDGVDPTPAGHELLKREWLACFESL